jgi:hypothetical protein
MANLVKKENNQLLIQQEVVEKLKEFKRQKKEIKKYEDDLKTALIKAMKESGVKSFENDDIKISYIEPTVRYSDDVDISKLKSDGLYSCYCTEKEIPVKESVRITVR